MKPYADVQISIEDVNSRDTQAFKKIFHKYYATLCFFAVKFVKDSDIAKDIVQEVFIRFYETDDRFKNEIALKSYLYVCVQHKALNYLEKTKIRNSINQSLTEETYTENEFLHHQIEAEIFEQIFAAIELLPAECRNIFKMSYIEHFDINEIATSLHISPATVKTQRQRAKKFLREHLQHLYTTLLLFF